MKCARCRTKMRKSKAGAPKLVKRIDSLTEEQKARIPEWVARWTAIGLRTGQADRASFERHVARCYEAAGMVAPRRVIWVPSPFALAIRAPTEAFILGLSERIAKNAQVLDQAGAQVRAHVGAQVRAQVGAQVGAQVVAQVGAQVGDQVGAQVGDPVGAQVAAQVAAQVGDRVGAQVDAIMRGLYQAISGSWSKYFGGQFWVGGWYWGSPSYVSFFRDVCALDIGDAMSARAIAYAGTVESACWWWPHRDFVMVCERPVHIDRDEQGRLHSTKRKAIAWPDGWGLYRLHGISVPGELIEDPSLLTVS